MGLSPPEFTVSRICFIVAALFFLARISWWVAVEHQSASSFFVISCIASAFIVIGLILGTGLLWINNREAITKEAGKHSTAAEIASELAKRIPSQTEKAILRFTFYPLIEPKKFIDTVTVPLENGIVIVDVTVQNIGTKQAGTKENPGNLWIQISEGCRFAEEPRGSEKMQPSSELARRIPFYGLLAGGVAEPYKLKIIPSPGCGSFLIGLKYGCLECPPVADEPQKLRVFVKR